MPPSTAASASPHHNPHTLHNPQWLAWKNENTADNCYKPEQLPFAHAPPGDKHSRDAAIASTEATIILSTGLDNTKQMAGQTGALPERMQAIEEATIRSRRGNEFVPSTNQ